VQQDDLLVASGLMSDELASLWSVSITPGPGREMRADRREIASAFDARAGTYARDGWHRRSAERLVELCRIRPDSHVLDAATGTGFAALAAARAVGPDGSVRGVDISPGMLREATAAVEGSGLANIAFLEADAVNLPQYGSETFDVITCASGLLYMPAADALREWHRLLKPGGLVAFSTMRAGSPPAGQLFRDCAAAFGLSLCDPSAPLGSVLACRTALNEAGFDVVDIVSEPVAFSPQDLALAWESNFRAVAHAAVRRLDVDRQAALKCEYLEAVSREESRHPGTLSRADILYALGRR
jgi:ubiquinone/menaquinone biosynthesis C-methylase UbiE